MTERSLFGHAFRGILTSLGGDVFFKVTGAAASFVVLHQLNAYQYGLWQLILSVVTVFATVTFPGVASMLVADVSRELGAGNVRRANGIIVRAAVLFVSLSSLGAVAMYVGAPFIHALSGINVVSLVQLLSLSVFAMGIRQVYQMMLVSHLQFIHGQAVKAAERAAYLVGAVVFLIIFDKSFEGVVYAYVFGSLAPIVLYAPYIIRMLRTSFADHERENSNAFMEAVWTRGRWAILTDGVNAAAGALWPWIIGYFLSVEAVGVVGIALLMLAQVAAFVPVAPMLRSVLPRTAESPERLREWLSRAMKLSLWGNVAAGAAAFLVASILFPVFFPQHVAALPLFAALLLSLPTRSVASAAAEWFYAMRMQRELFFASAVPKALGLLVLPLFVYAGGLIGYVLWYILHSISLVYARTYVVRVIGGSRLSLREILVPDRVDIELIERAIALVRTKLRSLL
jgi:O-antigen/teichoic acid export membrane protein